MTNQELKEHIRWLEDELSAATNIEDDISEIKSDLGRLFDAYNTIVDAFNQHNEALKKLLIEVLVPKPPPPPGDVLGELFANAPDTNNPKKRATNPKPRKTKLSVVPKDGDDGPGAAP